MNQKMEVSPAMELAGMKATAHWYANGQSGPVHVTIYTHMLKASGMSDEEIAEHMHGFTQDCLDAAAKAEAGWSGDAANNRPVKEVFEAIQSCMK